MSDVDENQLYELNHQEAPQKLLYLGLCTQKSGLVAWLSGIERRSLASELSQSYTHDL